MCELATFFVYTFLYVQVAACQHSLSAESSYSKDYKIHIVQVFFVTTFRLSFDLKLSLCKAL